VLSMRDIVLLTERIENRKNKVFDIRPRYDGSFEGFVIMSAPFVFAMIRAQM
jgi:hypothetical protein